MLKGASKVILETEWKKFEALVIPVTASKAQRIEMRKAFYAGATVIMSLLMALEEAPISDEVCALILRRVGEEIQAYMALLNSNNDTAEKVYRH